jgi:transposase
MREGLCAASRPPVVAARPLLPHVADRYFEGIDSELGLEWRCADSLLLRKFLHLSEREGVPDHSWLSRTRSRLPLEVHDQVFTWVLERLAAHGLIKGERSGVDASTMEANAALRTIVWRDSGEGYREMLTRMARESGIETPTADDLVRLDRNRKGKKLSNANRQSCADPDDKDRQVERRANASGPQAVACDGPRHRCSGRGRGACRRPGQYYDHAGYLGQCHRASTAVDAAPTPETPAEFIADKGYHSRDALKALDGGLWKSRISEPHRDGRSLWHGDDAARRAVYNSRTRPLSMVARQAFKLRAELVERGFALILVRGDC